MILVFGEVVPKSLAITHAEKISKRVARTIELLSMILFPLIKLLKLLINGLYNLFGMNKKRKKKEITEEDLITLINVGKDEGVIEEQEKKMIKNIFEFGDTTVKEVMIPRVDIDFAPHDVTLNSIVKMIKKSGHSRIPVYEGTIDNIIGILYVKDILKIYRKLFQLKETFDVKKILRKAYFVPENKKIDELLDIFQKDRIQIAIVIDEYSGTDGLVTMEDVLEEIVGEIIDEYDKEIELFKKIDENTFIADGMINIDKINEILHVKIPEDDFETLGGFIYKLIEKVPREEEEIIYKNIKIIIKRVIKNRIKRVKIIKLSPEIQKD
ncbi:MAG: HlyC/CorC family transporter, partial [Candidatus Atribacteria bacterium]|nr:HlyC/CorC family transporter [Candidatus Atribacteria bacterium]